MIRSAGPEHIGRVTHAVTADNITETDPRWAHWWALCSCGWETFETDRKDAQRALDRHIEDQETHSA